MTKAHSFHIPVMGIGYTADTPLRVSQLGIDSVISLVDDILLEKLRKVYCEKFEVPYNEITEKIEDFRAKRITSYLNLMQEVAENKVDELKKAAVEKRKEFKEYLNLLPDSSKLKEDFKALTSKYFNKAEIEKWVKDNLPLGSIDVNIMTKVDKDNYSKNEKLPVEYNDAHAALRGFAQSKLSSSVILSAGMNPRLYSYIEQFNDFFPNELGEIKKKVVLKVSDYRSALIQGKVLAKKGIWVSEYRIESGLNCGGHAFATDGFLMGPILAEFRDKRQELIAAVSEVLVKALVNNNRIVPNKELPLKITAQGGVGTSEEHDFLMEHYGVDSVGWGSPFLLVPEAVSIDEPTIDLLSDAKEDDLYLSNISPLGVPFNNLRGNTKDLEKIELVKKGKPGSVCPKRFVALNSEFTDKGMCTASRRYQTLKIKELGTKGLGDLEYKAAYNAIVEKSCICVGLGTSALLENHLDTKLEGAGVSVCPGPNMAYFDKKMSLKEMVDHIYGRANVITRTDRPNMFVKELGIYTDYLKGKVDEAKVEMNKKQEKYLSNFAKNLNEGIGYYQEMFGSARESFEGTKSKIMKDLEAGRESLEQLTERIENQIKISVAKRLETK